MVAEIGCRSIDKERKGKEEIRLLLIACLIIMVFFYALLMDMQRNTCEDLCHSEGYEKVTLCDFTNVHCEATEPISIERSKGIFTTSVAYYKLLNGSWVEYGYFQNIE